jgi:hypothetical protein
MLCRRQAARWRLCYLGRHERIIASGGKDSSRGSVRASLLPAKDRAFHLHYLRAQIKNRIGQVRRLQIAAQAAGIFLAAFPAASSFIFKIMMKCDRRGDQRVCRFHKNLRLFYRNIILVN